MSTELTNNCEVANRKNSNLKFELEEVIFYIEENLNNDQLDISQNIINKFWSFSRYPLNDIDLFLVITELEGLLLKFKRSNSYLVSLYLNLKFCELLCFFILILPLILKNVILRNDLKRIILTWISIFQFLPQSIILERISKLYNITNYQFLLNIWNVDYQNNILNIVEYDFALEVGLEVKINFMYYLKEYNFNIIKDFSDWISYHLDKNEYLLSYIENLLIFIINNKSKVLEDIIKLTSDLCPSLKNIILNFCNRILKDNSIENKFRSKTFSLFSLIEGPSQTLIRKCIDILESESTCCLRSDSVNCITEIILSANNELNENAILTRILNTLYFDPSCVVRRNAFECFCDIYFSKKEILSDNKVKEVILIKSQDKDKLLRDLVVEWLLNNWSNIPNNLEIVYNLISKSIYKEIESYNSKSYEYLIEKILNNENLISFLLSSNLNILQVFEKKILFLDNLLYKIGKSFSCTEINEVDESILSENLMEQ